MEFCCKVSSMHALLSTIPSREVALLQVRHCQGTRYAARLSVPMMHRAVAGPLQHWGLLLTYDTHACASRMLHFSPSP